MDTKTKTKAQAPAAKTAAADKKSKDAPAKGAAKATKTDAKPQPEGEEFKEFFVDGLKDILWAEKALLKALPKMRKAATSKTLAKAFDAHLSGTEAQIQTLGDIFGLLGEKPSVKKCDAMEGLIKETEGIIEDTDKGTAIRDAALILAAQKTEHYEIATYGTLAAFADAMGEDKIAKLLRSILKDERKTDDDLSALATSTVNAEAVAE